MSTKFDKHCRYPLKQLRTETVNHNNNCPAALYRQYFLCESRCIFTQIAVYCLTKFHPDRIRNDVALGFFEEGRPMQEQQQDNAI